MDVLSDVLAAVRLNGALFFDIDAGSPWVGESPPTRAIAKYIMPDAEHVIAFHAVMSGSCWVALGDGSTPPMPLGAGDVIVFPKGDANTLSSSPGQRGSPDMSMYHRQTDRPLPFVIRHGSDGPERTRFICGYLGCDSRPFNPLLSGLPALLCARRPADGGSWVTDLFDMALAEGRRRREGSETILAKISELMFVEVLRHHIESLPPESRGWLAGLRDPHIGAALRLIHARPADTWTIEGLAHEVGLSRTTFADRFRQYLDIPPMQYLARWRMQLAARRLETPGFTIEQVADEVGYGSEAAFNRAFKKLIGEPPGMWREARLRSGGSAGPS